MFNLNVKFIIYSGLLTLLIAYFIYHIVSANYGITSLISKRKSLEIIKIQTYDIENRVLHLQNSINKLTKVPYDLDLLDESARNLLGYKKRDEIVIDFK